MDRPTSSGHSTPISSSSTGSLPSTPASTIEEREQVRIIALLKAQDLEDDDRIVEIRELLRQHNRTVCLRFAWQRRSAPSNQTHFLDRVFALPALEAVKSNESLKVAGPRLVYSRASIGWRRRSAASNTEPPRVTENRRTLGPPKYQYLHEVPWGEPYVLEVGQMSPWSDMEPEFQLVLHHDCLVIAEIPAQPATRTPAKFEGNNKMQCALCSAILTCEKDFEEPCLFHPGNELDNTYLCCNREASEPGCVVEATHLSFLEVNDVEDWKEDWEIPEDELRKRGVLIGVWNDYIGKFSRHRREG